MTKEDLAQHLNGIEYPCRIPKPICQAAKEAGLVIVFGASDDLMEFRGAIEDEVEAYEGTTVLITTQGLWNPDVCQTKCPYYHAAEREAHEHGETIQALWDPGDGYSWRYETAIPHATFEIVEDGEVYCRGIVFVLSEVGA